MYLGWVCASMTSSLSIFQLLCQEDLFYMISRQSKWQFMFLNASFQKIGKLSFLFSLSFSRPSFFSFFLYPFLPFFIFFFYTLTEVLVMILIRTNEIMWLLSQFLRKSNSLIFQWNHNLILEHKVKSIPFSCRNRLCSSVLYVPMPPLPSCCTMSPSHSPTLGISEYSATLQSSISKVSCSFHLGSLLCKEILAFKKS